MCHRCDWRGAFNALRKFYGDPIIKDHEEPSQANTEALRAILNDAAEYYHDLLADHEDAYRFLSQERGLSLETIQKHQLGWADGALHIHFKDKYSLKDLQESGLVDRTGRDFFQNCITLPYHMAGNVVQIRGKQIGAKYLTPPGNKARLFNTDVTWGADQIIITEGEFDALILEQLGYAAVGVPGATSWQETWGGYFDDAKKVFVVFDNDTPGQTGAEKVALAIGPKARIVKMPEHGPGEKKNDPSEWIVNKGKSKDDFDMLLIKAKGGHLVTVDDGYQEWSEVQSLTGLKLGIAPIDRVLAPGILPAQVMIVLAKTGTGKTIFTLNVFQSMAYANPDARILFVSLEQTRGEWYERARRIFQFHNPDAEDKDILDYWRPRLLMVDKNRITEEELVSCIEQYEFELGEKPDLIAVDYLGYWARSYKGDPYERTSAAIMALKAIAKDQRVAFLAPHQVSRVAKFGEEMEADASRDSGVVEETADFMLTLWNEDNRKQKQQEEKVGAVNCKIVKSRHGGVGTQVQLQFAPLSLAMIPMGHMFAQRARDEMHWAAQGEAYSMALHRHRTGCRDMTCHEDCVKENRGVSNLSTT